MVTELLQKYIWLAQIIQRSGQNGMTLDEIETRWRHRFGGDYPRRTFNNHRAAIEEVFGISIECNRATNRYYIMNYTDVADGDKANAWLINTFTVNNMLALGRDRLQGRVAVDNIPSGHIYLTSVMEAMIEGRKIRISYQKYTSSEASSYIVHPYAVKEAEKRWYIVGYSEQRESMRVYGLDRIVNMEILEDEFDMPKGFDVDDLFATSFGIYLPDNENNGKTIKFRVNNKEAKYLRDLPLHKSQKEESFDGEFVTFSIFVNPNPNLIMEFCRRGRNLEVLEPEEVRNMVASELRAAADVYGK